MADPAERERVVGQGEGGDETSAIDEAAERAVVARLDADGADFTLVSEELGIRPARGDGAGTYVVVDPIDGSINAKRGIPFFSLSIAVADGPTMGDVQFGYVYDLGSREEWTAQRGGGAFLNERAAGSRHAAGSDRAAVARGHANRPRRAACGGARAGRASFARDGVARALPLSPRRGPGRRCVFAQARTLRRHCRRAVARRRDRPRHGLGRRRLACGASARPRGPIADRRGGDARALRADRRGAAAGVAFGPCGDSRSVHSS